MEIVLIRDLTGITYCGYVPNVPYQIEGDPRFERIQLEEEDADLLVEDFVEPIDKLCGALLDDGDFDYFDKNKCLKMKRWLEERLKKGCSSRLGIIYTKLLKFSEEAIGLNTGIIIDL